MSKAVIPSRFFRKSNSFLRNGITAALQGTCNRGGATGPIMAEMLEERALLSAVLLQGEQAYPTGTYPNSVVVGDLGNGPLGLVVANGNSGTISVFLGIGNGTLAAQQTYPVGTQPNTVVLAALGNGATDDIIVANGSSNTVSVLLGNGNGTFQAQQTYAVGADPDALAVGDLGNGHVDLVVANYNDNTIGVLLGNGDGTFQPMQTFPAGSGPDAIAIAQLGDAHPDVIVTNRNDNTISVLHGNGNGTFQAPVAFAVGHSPQSIAVGNFGNNQQDVAVVNTFDSTISVLLGNGNGTFQTQTTYATGFLPYAIVAGNLSGQTDLAIVNEGDNTIALYAGNGDGTFQTPVTYATGAGPTSIALGKLRSNFFDVVTTNSSANTVGVHLGGPGDTTTTLASSANPATIGSAVRFTATVVGANATPTGTVTFYNGATSLGSATLTLGSASISVSSLAIGSDSITAQYNGDSSSFPSTSAPLTEVVAAALQNLSAHLVGSVPSSVVAGTLLKAKEKLTFTATNGAVIGKGHATILLSPDTTAASSVLTLSNGGGAVRLKAGKARTFALRFPRILPASIAAGSYNILIQLTDTTGLVATLDSGQSLTVVPAKTDLTGTFVTTPSSVKSGKKASVTFLLTNSSAANVPASGNLSFAIDQTADGQIADATLLELRKKHINLQPGKSIRITLSETIHASTYLAIQLDPGKTGFPTDINLGNNSFVTPRLITVG